MRPLLATSLSAVLLILILILGTSCLSVQAPGPALSSEPPGARVRVDGRDSGWVTPCQIALDEDRAHVLTLELEGYAPRELRLEPLERHGIIAWRQGVNGVKSTIRFPILMPAVDLLLPFRELGGLAPSRVFVRLRPADAP
jgi:hypothetical protein